MSRNMTRKMYLKLMSCLILFLMWIPGISNAHSNPHDISDLFEAVNDTVVSIYTLRRDISGSKAKNTRIKKEIGSGVVISNDGLVMTASHVVHVADRVIVKFSNGKAVEANVISTIPSADLGLLKLKELPKGIAVAKLADSDRVRPGDPVFVIGGPYGIEHTLTVGYVSGRVDGKRGVRNIVPTELIQIDAAVNPGNSGGPVFNMNGEVISIVSHILSKSGGFEGLGFSVSINAAKKLLLEQDPFWSGIEFYLVSGELASALNIPQDAGFLIQKVAYQSPADNSGLKQGTLPVIVKDKKILLGGDVILKINDVEITEDLEHNAAKFAAFEKSIKQPELDLQILRNGTVIQIQMNR